MKHLYLILVSLISFLSYSQYNKSTLTCSITLVGSSNPTAFNLCNGTMTISLTNCTNPPYQIQWINTNPSPACQTLPPTESNFIGTTYTVNTLCGCGTQYNVLVTNSLGEQSSIPVVIINPAPTGIIDLSNKTDILITPNPACEILNIYLKDLNIYDTRVDISNSLGEIILSSSLTTEQHSINILPLSNGVYFTSLYDSGKLIGVKKIMIQK